MNTLSYKTKSATPSDIKRDWYIIDGEGEVVGRMASRIAHVLKGKHKPQYTPHMDCGDCVIVINADKVRFTGNKWNAKEYISYSLYPGGQKRRVAKEVQKKKPESIVEMAVKGMLPKNSLGKSMFRKLYVYTGSEHPHQAQNPQPFKF